MLSELLIYFKRLGKSDPDDGCRALTASDQCKGKGLVVADF